MMKIITNFYNLITHYRHEFTLRLNFYICRNVNTRSIRFHNKNSGFTLLELVLVLFILAILTTVGLTFIENEDGQLRYNNSIIKRDAIVDALYRETFEGNQRILTGYIVDNGRLPPIDAPNDNSEVRVRYLLNNVDLETYAAVNAYANTDGAIELLDDGLGNNFPLFKGYRSGNYLRADNEGDGAAPTTFIFKDQWGESFFISDLDTPVANSLVVGYDGDGTLDYDNGGVDENNQLVKPAPFNIDSEITISEDDWTIDRDELHIIFTTNDAACVGACDYTIAVSVFRNNTNCANPNESNCWDTYYFTRKSLSDGDTHDTLADIEVWNFLGNGSATRIPAGDHLVVVLDNAGDPTVLTQEVIKVLPNSTQPTVTLTVP
jgi:prepilin-type N-terminal cleavage/methylation domain-containing protein